jgi:imidazolonepropionase-like amidohydrolase
VLLEAAKAYKNGLKYHVALAGVTSASAEILGLGNRIGKVKAGFDADIVIWDSDPLSLGATPLQVFIDGIPQFEDPVTIGKPISKSIQHLEDNDVRTEHVDVQDLIVSGVTKILGADRFGSLAGHEFPGNMVIHQGKIVCVGICASEITAATNARRIHLRNGHVTPSLTAFGSLLGLEEIQAEDDTSDGANDQDSFSAALDGLAFEGKNLDAALSHGVTRAISAPAFNGGGHKGISAGIRIAAKHALQPGAVWNSAVAVHYSLGLGTKQGRTPSLSSALNDLKSKLLKASRPKSSESNDDSLEQSLEDSSLASVTSGNASLVIDVHSADAIASLLRLKSEFDAKSNTALRLVILGGAESHLLAPELALANVPVILAPVFAYSTTWDQRRSLSGAPLTNGTAIDVLHAAGVKVALGVDEDWEARDLFVQAGIIAANSPGGKIGAEEAINLASRNIYEILGLGGKGEEGEALGEFVVWEGSPLEINGQRRAVGGGMGSVRVWE